MAEEHQEPQPQESLKSKLGKFAKRLESGEQKVGVKTGEPVTEEDKKAVLGNDVYKKAINMPEQEIPKPND